MTLLMSVQYCVPGLHKWPSETTDERQGVANWKGMLGQVPPESACNEVQRATPYLMLMIQIIWPI